MLDRKKRQATVDSILTWILGLIKARINALKALPVQLRIVGSHHVLHY
jgi:hypothetical protein